MAAPLKEKTLEKLQLINMTGLRQFIPIYIGLRLVMCNPQQIIKWLDLIEKIYVNGYLVFAYSPAKFESHLHNAAYRVYKSGLFQTNVDEGYEQIKGYDREKLDNAHYELKKSINDLIGLENQDYRTTFINQMSTIQISNNKTINYLLRRIEVFTRGETEEITLDDELTVEHILPNYYKKTGRTYHFTMIKNMLKLENNLSGSTVHSQFVNRLGNHTLLTKKWNSSLRDSPFHTKKEKLSNSEFKINNHPDQPISVCFYKDWNADSIVKRQKELAKKGLEIWGLDI